MAKVRYKGGGFIPGIPARDLSAEEVKRYGLDKLLKSGIYEEVSPKKITKRKSKVIIEPAEELEDEQQEMIEEG